MLCCQYVEYVFMSHNTNCFESFLRKCLNFMNHFVEMAKFLPFNKSVIKFFKSYYSFSEVYSVQNYA